MSKPASSRHKTLQAVVALLVLVLFGAASVFESHAQQSSLPDGKGAEIAGQRCLVCHGADLILQQRLARAGWEREADKMIRWGASLSEAEKETLVDYLARYFSPRQSQAAAEEPPTNDRGKTLFKSRCLICHSAMLAQQQRLTRASWVRDVDKMIRWGAAVSETEKDSLVDYLSSRFGSGGGTATR